MTSIGQIAASPASPLLHRTAPQRAIERPVYDPVLAEYARSQNQPVEEITVSAPKADDEAFSFWDVLDLINPLQHIPIVNTIYRELTGDTIKTPVKIIGATVLGGPIGFAAAMIDSVVEQSTGKDVGGHAMALLKDDTAPKPETSLAKAAPAQITQIAASNSREFIPDDPAMAMTSKSSVPSEAEAFVKTAQIAAQANVFPTFKRTQPARAAQAQQAEQPAGHISALNAQTRFMPIKRDASERTLVAATQRDGDATSLAELKARGRVTTSAIATGRPVLAPASLAVATAAQTKNRQPETDNDTPAASAQEAFAYGRNVASAGKPAEMPAWFDTAMLGAIDKYKAMQQVQ
ncbi:MAG: hypothetical protein EXR11_01855 [Rhodospirillaceae bacterium]|nr:hypothetical protein [Rhodospirillaceae bacterium]